MTSKHKRRPVVLGISALLASTIVLAGCSSGGGVDASSTPQTSAQQSDAASAQSSTAQSAPTSASSGSAIAPAVLQNLKDNLSTPTFTPPGPAIDISSLKGKLVFDIPQTNNPFISSVDNAIEEAAKLAGMRFTRYSNQGQTSQWLQGMNAAITAKADVIILNGSPDPRALQPQIQQAKEAGIPVIVGHDYDETSPLPPKCPGCSAGVAAIVPAPFTRAGRAAVDWMIQDSQRKAHVYVLASTDVIGSPPTVDVIKKEFAQYCPECTVTVQNVPVANWNTEVQGDVQAALKRDPSINYVYPLYDAMVGGAVTAIQTVGKASTVKVVSYNGSPYALKFIQDHTVVAMDVGEDTAGIGYADMDQAFRLLLGKSAVPERTAIRIWDATNVADAGTPPVIGKGYGTAAVDGYKKLWGLG